MKYSRISWETELKDRDEIPSLLGEKSILKLVRERRYSALSSMGHKEMSYFVADQHCPRIRAQIWGDGGGGELRGLSQ
jgi:hypothetical protein